MSNRQRAKGVPRLGKDDPREFSGPGIVGPGGPRDRGMIVFPSTSAVLLQSVDVCEVDTKPAGEPGQDMQPMFVMTLGGRVNKSPDLVDISYLLNADGAAGLITQLYALACRSGIRDVFTQDLRIRMAELDSEGNLDDMTGPHPAGTDH